MLLQKIKLALQRVLNLFIPDNANDMHVERAEEQTRDILRYIQSGQWTMLRQQLASPLRLFLSESFLESGWRTILSTTGPLRRTGRPVVTKGWFSTCTKVPLQFGHLKLALSLRMTPSGKLVALHLIPETPQPWSRPSYAAEDAKEVGLTLGRGLRKVHAVLTLPDKEHRAGEAPCIILIGGSGPVDRDSSVGALKPFKDLALGLADRGIAVCRFDKVTSTILGKLSMSNSRATLTSEYVHHVVEAVRKVRNHRDIDANRIILLGHSLGAIIAARLASTELSVAGCILMAAPVDPLYRVAIRQMRYLSSFNDDDNDKNSETVSASCNPLLESLERQAEMADSATLSKSTPASQLPFGIGPAYWLEYRVFNPLDTLKDVHKPVLLLQGGRDYQATVKEDYEPLHARFKDQANFEFHVYRDLNHLFIRGQGASSPLEYDDPGNVDIEVILDIERWTKQLCQGKAPVT